MKKRTENAHRLKNSLHDVVYSTIDYNFQVVSCHSSFLKKIDTIACKIILQHFNFLPLRLLSQTESVIMCSHRSTRTLMYFFIGARQVFSTTPTNANTSIIFPTGLINAINLPQFALSYTKTTIVLCKVTSSSHLKYVYERVTHAFSLILFFKLPF